jgi:hypothetical protein
MRNTLIGVGAAAAIIVVLFVLSRLIPAPEPQQTAVQAPRHTPEEIAQAAARVTPGFVGQMNIGDWDFGCSKDQPATGAPPNQQSGAAAPTLDASGGAAAPASSAASNTAAQPAKPASDIKLGRCRAALLVRNSGKTKAVVLIAVFRLVEGADEIAMILHIPPVVQPGAKVIVALAEKEVIGLPVTGCEKGQCVALGILKPKVYPVLLARPKLAVVIPVPKTGQKMIIPVSMVGLPQSVQAMRQAG